MDWIEQGKELAQQGNYTEALRVFEKALKNDPKNPDLLFFVGTCHSSIGDFPVAKFYYQEVLKIDPNHSRTRMVWDGLEEIVARPPSDAKDSHQAAAETKPLETPSSLAMDTTREPKDPWADAFPDEMLSRPRRRGLGILFWLLVALAIAALVYFQVGPRFLR